MADAYAPDVSGRVAARHRAPGLRADQRDDRHHRGRQEPHPAGRARRRGDRRRGPTSTSTSRRWRAAVGAVPMRVDVGGGRGATRGGGRTAARSTSAVRSLLNLPLDVQAEERPGRVAAAPSRRRARAPSRRREDVERLAAALRARRAAGVRRRPRRPRSGCARGAGEARRARRRAAGDVRRRQGPVPRQPLVAGRLRRLRHAAGRRADPRRRPDRRLGLRAEHVDHAPRRADRPGRHRRPGRRRRRRRSARTGRSTFGVVGDVAGSPHPRVGDRCPGRGTRLPHRRRPAARIAGGGPLARRALRRPERRAAGSTRAR